MRITHLLKNAIERSGLSYVEVAKAAGLNTQNPSDTIYKTLKEKRRSIHLVLADWALAQTLYNTSRPIHQALSHLIATGFTRAQIQAIAEILRAYRPDLFQMEEQVNSTRHRNILPLIEYQVASDINLLRG